MQQTDEAGSQWTYEDFTPGRIIPLGSYQVTREDILKFARIYDPQPMHLDEDAAENSLLGGLAASGFHTCSILMRLMHDGYLHRSTAQGSPGLDRISWPRPVHPGDRLSGTCHVLEGRISKSRPNLGLVGLRHTLTNQRDELVLEMHSTGMFLTRDLHA